MLEESVSSLFSWFTPTVFFLLLQLVIATIYISSTFSNNKHHHQHNDQNAPHHLQTHNFLHQQQPLARSPSLLHRLKSINFYSYTHTPSQHETVTHQQTLQQTPQLPRSTSSMIQRLKSINLHTYFPTETFSSYFTTDASASNFNSNSNGTPSLPEEPPRKSPHVPKTPLLKTENQKQRYQEEEFEESDGGDDDDVVGEIQNNLERVHDSCGSASMDEIFSKLQQGQGGNFARTRSDTEPASGEVPVKLPRKMKKSASTKSAFSHFEEGDIVEKRRPATAREGGSAVDGGGGGGGGEVDAKADDFINRFKQQLKLQRLDSIMRYKEMIGRGT